MAGGKFTLVLVLMAALLFCGLAVLLRSMESRAVAGAALDDQLAAGKIRPLADVIEAVRQAKLVTVEIDTRVIAETADSSWRGDVSARVEAPVRLLYGTDLSRLDVDSLAFSPVSRAYLVRIPPPERIATEVCGSDEDFDVQVGWLRLRSRAGEYHLGLARRHLYERAREMTLSPADAQRVREITREQVEAIVRRIVGERAAVQVMYQQEWGP